VIIQNGVGNEDAFRERFPSVTIISCVVRFYTDSKNYSLTDSRRG
jgi:ketopantoate reductase